MPKQQMSRKRGASDEYDSDGGFVEDARKNKKSKSTTDSNKTSVSHDLKEDDDGNPYWELSGKRRLGVSEYNKQTFVNIREYYEKDGKALPGKKGISLSLDQFNGLVELLPQLEGVLTAKGFDISRPQYGQKSQVKAQEGDEEEELKEEVKEEEQGEDASSKTKNKLDKYRMKKNHEATSDEDSE